MNDRKVEFFLFDVDAIEETTAVIPNIGGEANAYFEVTRKEEWAGLFDSWLNDPFDPNDLADSDEEDNANDAQNNDEISVRSEASENSAQDAQD